MDKKLVFTILLLCASALLQADTFVHKQTKQVYHGYAKQTDENGLTEVQTAESGPLNLNLTEFNVTIDKQGRNPFVSLLSIPNDIEYELETGAFEKALQEEADKGPLFVLIELDTPGGRVDFAQRICNAISELDRCRTIAYISGGKQGGAYSAGAAVALSCDQIYMAPASSFGAATLVASVAGKTVDIEKVAGDNVGEKSRSVWRNFLAALAEKNGRPAILAKAMEDKEITVLEVHRAGKTFFVESSAKQHEDQLVRTFCKKGELLTLTAENALHCGMADGIADSRVNLLKSVGAPDAEIRPNENTLKAREEIDRVFEQMEKLGTSLDLRFREISAKAERGVLTRSAAMKDLKSIVKQIEYLLRLKKTYPDVPIRQEDLEEFLNVVKADYESIRAVR